jgi:NAD(P)-dependent dehydrogenase (short-subunit alcohol dehydrogenase family)
MKSTMRNWFDLGGKVAVITGAASGIGRATAERFAAAGATVVLADIADAAELASDLSGTYVRTDVSREDDVAALMSAAAGIRGAIDICVNNAGITVAETPIATTDRDQLRRAIDVNTVGAFLGLKHAPPHMRDGGSIINTSSLAAVIGFPSYAAYAASKAAILSLTMIAALELGPSSIRVNAVCPSSVDTPMLRAQETGELEAAIARKAAPLGTIIQPDHVAALIHFLAADDCPVLTGQALNIDAGVTAGISIGLIESVAATSGNPVIEHHATADSH